MSKLTYNNSGVSGWAMVAKWDRDWLLPAIIACRALAQIHAEYEAAAQGQQLPSRRHLFNSRKRKAA